MNIHNCKMPYLLIDMLLREKQDALVLFKSKRELMGIDGNCRCVPVNCGGERMCCR